MKILIESHFKSLIFKDDGWGGASHGSRVSFALLPIGHFSIYLLLLDQ